jgi:hypothetical protein
MRILRSICFFLFTIAIFPGCEVKVPPKPVASFTIGNNNCTVPCEVTFANTSINASNYRWDFGDGSTSTEISVKKTFTTAGNRQVKLIATGTGGSSGAMNTITIQGYAIGSTGPAGGLIFYDKGNSTDGWRYLEAAPMDIAASVWGCYCTQVNTSNVVGSGKSNSQNLLATCGIDGAAGACAALKLNGYADWYLPSKGELDLLYKNLHLREIGGFSKTNLYWSSSAAPYGSCDIDGGAAVLNFGSGEFSSHYRNGVQGIGIVRAIRQF